MTPSSPPPPPPPPPSLSFFDHLCSPFFSAFRVLGFCPYTRNTNGVFRKKIVSASAAYTLCSGVAFGYGTATAATALFLRPPPAPAVSDFNRALLSFAGAAFFAPSLVVPAAMWFETDKLQAYLREWQRFQTDYDRIIGKPDRVMTEDAEKRVNRIFRLIVAFLTVTGVTLAWTTTAADVTLLVCAIKNISTMAFFTGFWSVGAMVFEVTIDNYKRKLRTDADRGPVHGHTVEDYRLLWIRMSRLVHEAGNYVSATITFCVFYTAVVVVLTAYALAAWGTTLARLGRYDALASAAAMLVCNGAALYVYCDRGYSQTRKCIDGMILLILNMKSTTTETWQNSNCIQITLFLNAVSQYQPDVNVVGFYEINRGLFGSILSLLVTYLIVLIQLNSSFNTPNVEYKNNITTIEKL